VREIDEKFSGAALNSIEGWDFIQRFFHKLSKKDQEIAIFYYADGMTQGEIAEATGWSRQTINKKLKDMNKKAEEFKLNARV
jgi:predicted DNA-binding protein YlxM (UPF0122 family)